MSSFRNQLQRRLIGELLESRRLLSAIGFVTHDIIKSDAAGASSVLAADIDGDGDVDAISTSPDNDQIAWYPNIDGKGTFGKQRIIAAHAIGARNTVISDVDGDGDVDVVGQMIDAAAGPLRVPVAPEVRGDDVIFLPQRLRHPIPIAAVVLPAVHQEQRWRVSVAPVDVVQSQALGKIDVRGRTVNRCGAGFHDCSSRA